MNVYKILIVTILSVALIIGCSSQNASSDQEITNGDVDATNTKIEVLPKVEKPYPPEKAVENGDIVNLHGKYSNLDVWQDFLKNLEIKKPDTVRITQYSVEGNPIFYEFFFNGKQIEYTFDNSMDAYAGQGKGRQNTLCNGIIKKKVKESATGELFVLSGCASEEIGNTFYFSGENF